MSRLVNGNLDKSEKLSEIASSISTKKDLDITDRIGGKVVFDQLFLRKKLSNGDEAVINLIPRYLNLIIYESITSHSLSGSITINDTDGFMEKFFICGGEELVIKVSKSFKNELIFWREDFIIYKMRTNDLDELTLNSTVTLDFTTKTFVKSVGERFFRSFKNISLSNAIKEAYKKITGYDNIFVSDSNLMFSNLAPYVSPGLSPLNLISEITKRMSVNGNYYVFFERLIPLKTTTDSSATKVTASHCVVDLNYLMKYPKYDLSGEESPIYTIVFQPKLTDYIESDLGSSFIRTAKVTRLSNFNHIDAMLSGFYKMQLKTLKLENRSYFTEEMEYQKMDRGVGATKKSVVEDFYDNLIPIDSIFQQKQFKLISTTEAKNFSLGNQSEGYQKHKWLSNQLYGQIKSNLFKMEVVIEGGTNKISVGTVVDLKVPSLYKKIINPSSGKTEDDALLSGYYLVTNIKHDFKNDTYIKTLELSRGSSYTQGTSNVFDNTQKSGTQSVAQKNSNYNSVLYAENKSISEIRNSLIEKAKSIKFLGKQTSIARISNTGIPDENSKNLLKSLGIKLYGSSLPTSTKTSLIVEEIYKDILERVPTTSELDIQVNAIDRGLKTARQLQIELAISGESLSKYGINPFQLLTSQSLKILANSIRRGEWSDSSATSLNAVIMTMYPDSLYAITEEILSTNKKRLQAKL